MRTLHYLSERGRPLGFAFDSGEGVLIASGADRDKVASLIASANRVIEIDDHTFAYFSSWSWPSECWNLAVAGAFDGLADWHPDPPPELYPRRRWRLRRRSNSK